MLTVEAEINEVTQYLTKLERKSIPRATANAFKQTGFYLRNKLAKEARERLDRPIKFTQSGFQFKAPKLRARLDDMVLKVFIEKKRWRYMKWMLRGGTQTLGLMTAPVHIRLNKYGNIPGLRNKKTAWKAGKVSQRGEKGRFIAQMKYSKGVWKLVGKDKKPQLLVDFAERLTYKPIFPFREIVAKGVNKKFAEKFHKEITYELKKIC